MCAGISQETVVALLLFDLYTLNQPAVSIDHVITVVFSDVKAL